MKISVEVNGNQERQLAEASKRLNIRPEDLAAAAVQYLLAQAEESFQEGAGRILKKNWELYRRLS